MMGPQPIPAGMEWLPSDPPRPAPAVMTAVEAAIYLRLAEDRDIGDALDSLAYLVRHKGLRPCRIGKLNRYARWELDRFVAEQTEARGRRECPQKCPRSGDTNPYESDQTQTGV